MSASRVLLLPGWQNSGPGHWQSLWQAAHGYRRVEQHDWMRPLRGDWVARLQEVVLETAPGPAPQDDPGIVLVAHSLGCMLVAAWAALSPSTDRIRGALLVAPGDPQREELAGVLSSWSPIVSDRLPFPSILLGSRNDPYCSLARAQGFAAAWGSQFVDCGLLGHINADAGLGSWPAGHERLARLCRDNVQKGRGFAW